MLFLGTQIQQSLTKLHDGLRTALRSLGDISAAMADAVSEHWLTNPELQVAIALECGCAHHDWIDPPALRLHEGLRP